MGFLDWIKNRNLTIEGQGVLDWIRERSSLTLEGRGISLEPPAPNSKQRYSKRGNPIAAKFSSYWRKNEPLAPYKTRRHIGRSIEGFHAGLEISFKEGTSVLKWSNARRDVPSAEKAAHGMEKAWERYYERLEPLHELVSRAHLVQGRLDRPWGFEHKNENIRRHLGWER
jgi:hypothetical protein